DRADAPATSANPSSAWANVMTSVWRTTRDWPALTSPLVHLQRAQNRRDLAEDGCVVAEDGLEARVAGEQPGVAIALTEHLDRGLFVEHGRNDVAVLGVLLRMD